MNSIDEQIRKALTAEDQKTIDEIDEQAGLFEIIGLTFKGKQAWMTYYMWALGFLIFIVGVYFVGEYIGTSDIKTSLSWGLAIIACMLIITIVKVMSFQQMMKMELMREIKRLEMRVMLLAERQQDQDSQAD
jgi:membrane protein insertase Oxa1/YidC/SpoIIIJ